MQFLKTPYLQLPQTDGMTVMWQTDAPSSSLLHLWPAEVPDCGDERGDATYTPRGEPLPFAGEDGTVHRVTACGLASGTDYCYQAISERDGERIASGIGVLRTAPGPEAPCSFAVTSETGGAGRPDCHHALVEAMAQERPDFLLLVGDMVADGRRSRDWDEFLFIPFRRLIGHTPFYHCAGNHEEHSPLMAAYLATPPCGYYSFDYGPAHVVALDSTQMADHVEDADGSWHIVATAEYGPGTAQYEWLAADLAGCRAPWKIVFFHYPPYVASTWEATVLRGLAPLFERAGVDIVFASHTIVYERSHPIAGGRVDDGRGVRYVVVGGAGAMPKWFHHKKAWHTARSRAVPHFVHVALTPTHLELQAIDHEGRLFDVLTLDR